MAFKVEYAKFNVLPNQMNSIRSGPLLDDGGVNLRNSTLLPTTTASGDLTNFAQMNTHHYKHGYTPNNFADPYYHQPYPGMFKQENPDTYPGMFKQESHDTYSPMSSTSNNVNELNYQVNASISQMGNDEYNNVNSMYCPVVIPTEMNETNANNMYPLTNLGYSDVHSSLTTAGRGVYSNGTGVVYTTLTDCRFGENQPLNLPSQPVAECSRNYTDNYTPVSQVSHLDN